MNGFNDFIKSCPLDKSTQVSKGSNFSGVSKEQLSLKSNTANSIITSIVSALSKKSGIYTQNHLYAAGFQYTGYGDTARCKDCGLEVSGWTADMKPHIIHSKQRPECPFILSLKQSIISNKAFTSLATTTTRRIPIKTEPENPSKRQKIEPINSDISSNTLLETNLLKQVRLRTFSHWSRRTIPSTAQMIESGFFNCNVGDRVICIYCNLICQQWTPHSDDPCEVHKTLRPNCIYVTAKLIRPAASSIIIVNENSTSTTSNINSSTSTGLDPLRSNEIVFTAACNPAYTEIPKRHASFGLWPAENLPSIDDLVRAGFFYTGTKTIVTCFYCNGSLQNWGPNDNPMIEHARWFPHCAYAKQLCGDDLYRKIQESIRAQQERARANELKEKTSISISPNSTLTINSQQLLIPDEDTLSRFVQKRLESPISQCLLDKKFELSIIKRCWEDQLRLKKEDFISGFDLSVAYSILQKQNEHIDDKKENIVIPSIKMKQIREQIQNQQNAISFIEERNKTIEREQSFIEWSQSSPSPVNMVTSGWFLDKTKSRDHTRCQYCNAEHHNWQPTDNPRFVHNQLSPYCSFLLSPNPMHPSSVSIKPLHEVLTREIIANELDQPTSDIIAPSFSPYGNPLTRKQSFSAFPGGQLQNMSALVQSGFYFTGNDTILQCYNCSGKVNDLHKFSSTEINAQHCSRFPNCHFAQLLPKQAGITSINNVNVCKWCLINPKELVVYSCQHRAVCKSCAQVINTCPVCGIVAKVFMTIPM
ncbi:unnamed protein product [Adineta steineri]|uniref:RING-type domain-containing protein n=1 Tax=Adineta steineri TaxID=433720 RepID=A0A819QNH6_9BILA|nr:unnamed protein product [Adineta steineri]CAF4028218.1 unnamed protein product [Adineta steineri]